MKKLTLLLSIALVAASNQAHAGRGEAVGMGAGAVIGAIAGGPVGLFVGAAIGNHYGGSVATAAKVPELTRELGVADNELVQAQARADALRKQMAGTAGELAMLNQQVTELMVQRSLLAGLKMDVLYTTGQSGLDDAALQRLEALARVLDKMPELQVELSGFADKRGGDQFNATLSEARARGVEQVLIAAGIDPRRIVINAYGESLSQAEDNDGFALERRVTVQLLGKGDGSVAHSH